MVNYIDTENKISTFIFMKYVVIRNIENKVLSVCKTQSRVIKTAAPFCHVAPDTE